ncbi:glycosyltransferase family 2 protein [uncultured Lacinutrix sp.]|uniref:glycosyltransferase family 2 protein n=1 Tax=uncultured Lacinutrix sp. TaxID=574032 RepID=UPI0026222BF2|nr:glycosyltransferase family 2 protein [uncultured Lacinutrix sp.]
MANQPLITVLIPTYNCELYVKEAVQSILDQTYSNFECIIIDDCSTDKTIEILKSFNDNRIKLIEKPKNSGYTNSLNYGLTIAKGKYIARMDGDDISLPTRFEKQVAIFETNPKLVVCGSIFQIIDSDQVIYNPESHQEITLAMLKDSAIGHPTAMLRASTLKEHNINYDVSKEPAEDYDLWVRLLEFGEFYNIQELLFLYRVHEGQVSITKKEKQRTKASESRFKMLSYFNVPLSELQKEAYINLFSYTNKVKPEDVFQFLGLRDAVNSSLSNFIDKREVRVLLKEYEKAAVRQCFLGAKTYNLKLYFDYVKLKRKLEYRLNSVDEAKLLIKSILHKSY